MLPELIALAVPIVLLALVMRGAPTWWPLGFFGWGALAGVLGDFIEKPLLGVTGMSLDAYSITGAPPLEEFLKIALLLGLVALNALHADDERLVLYGICAGMGFSTAENLLYLTSSAELHASGATALAATRSLSTTIMHGLTAGSIALCVYLAYGAHPWRFRPRWPLVAVAFALATAAHALFNVYVESPAHRPAAAVAVSLAVYAVATWLVRTRLRPRAAAP